MVGDENMKLTLIVGLYWLIVFGVVVTGCLRLKGTWHPYGRGKVEELLGEKCRVRLSGGLRVQALGTCFVIFDSLQ